MREYELTAVFDLSLIESSGPDASAERIQQLVESRGGKLLKIDHWGRRRLAYPIRHAIDADYIVTRFEADPAAVNEIEAALRIDEKIFRHLIVRADELPTPPPPREPREPREPRAEAAPPPAPAPAPEATQPEATQPVAETSETPAAVDEPDAAPES
ncbi:30S ribosomal protein S6 [Tepidiforma sp.]|uniref:30S ribosomal protein S6 n=1 Tax=Tepidiforma sp. TaxID=2682230 RepID=UPI002ADE8D93|nr:30S ribosomal protein S6 [Tepidiforma sp.]